jgi:hypothetical protein
MCFVISQEYRQFKGYFPSANPRIDWSICDYWRAEEPCYRTSKMFLIRQQHTCRAGCWQVTENQYFFLLQETVFLEKHGLCFSKKNRQTVTNTYSEETGRGVPELCCRDKVPPSRSSASVCKN